jgi:hypothetical protein
VDALDVASDLHITRSQSRDLCGARGFPAEEGLALTGGTDRSQDERTNASKTNTPLTALEPHRHRSCASCVDMTATRFQLSTVTVRR